jgi:excisionase family DNA binding protein
VPGVDDEILTIREFAALLKIGKKNAYTMAQSGELPGFKVRDQ